MNYTFVLRRKTWWRLLSQFSKYAKTWPMNEMSVRSTNKNNKLKDKIFTVNNIISFEIVVCVCVCVRAQLEQVSKRPQNSLSFLSWFVCCCFCVCVLFCIVAMFRPMFLFFLFLHNQLCLVLPSSMLTLLFVFFYLHAHIRTISLSTLFLPSSLYRDFLLLIYRRFTCIFSGVFVVAAQMSRDFAFVPCIFFYCYW